jgi:ABC-type multidrug transport system ATPase subunit
MPPGSPALVVRGLLRRFGRRWALGGIDLDLPSGGGLMVTGPNGSGKTTLLRCLATALKPHGGTVHVGGLEAWEHRDDVRRRTALVSHAARLYDDLDAGENLGVWRRVFAAAGVADGLGADAALDRVGLAQGDRALPARALSWGMRRRLSLAIALLRRAELFLIDEPFGAVDPEGRDLVASVLAGLRAEGRTLVLATHRPDLAGSLCDRAIHLEAGQVVRRT